MEVFPIDLIAREGPLSFFRKDIEKPVIGIREELDCESFKIFYDYCLLMFNASQEDINLCIDYLPQATAKEKALILTLFYVYAHPWEKYRPITKVDDSYFEALKTRSWMSLQFPCDAFGYSNRIINLRGKEENERLFRIIAQYTKKDDIAFKALESDKEKTRKERRDKWLEIQKLVDSLDIKTNDSLPLNLPARKIVVDEILRLYPDSASEIISDLLYISYSGDMIDLYESGLVSTEGNASEKPKTLGQIARQLLESWDPPQTIDDQE